MKKIIVTLITSNIYLFSSFILHLLVFSIFISYQKVNPKDSLIEISVIENNSAFKKLSTKNQTSKVVNHSQQPSLQSSENNVDDQTEVLGSKIGIKANYPRLSRLLGETGTVVIKIEDKVPFIIKSSGFERLDHSALNATYSALSDEWIKENISIDKNIKFIYRLKN